MPTKRRKANEHGSSDKKVVRKIIIDDDEVDDEQQKGNVKSQKQLAVDTMKNSDEEVIAEIGVFLLSPEGSNQLDSRMTTSSNVGINRLQFPQQQPFWLNDDGSNGGGSNNNNPRGCYAQYKSQVRHLKLKFGEQEQQFDMEDGCTASRISTQRNHGGYGGGIADLLMNRSSSNIFPSPQVPSTSSSSSLNDAKAELFTGEGYSYPGGIISSAVGFFKGGKLFLLPIDKTYEMRKPLAGVSEKDAAAKSTQKATISDPTKPSNLSPLRIRFARAENEMQRRRREQSSFYKQKLVEQDQWVSLHVEKSKITDLYRDQINCAGDTEEWQNTTETRINQ